jgi:hypothetical protein
MECVAILDVCGALEIGDAELRAEAAGLLVRVVEMLTRMCR